MPGVSRRTVMMWLEDHINALPEPIKAEVLMAKASYELGVPKRSLKEYLEVLADVNKIGMTKKYFVWSVREVWALALDG